MRGSLSHTTVCGSRISGDRLPTADKRRPGGPCFAGVKGKSPRTFTPRALHIEPIPTPQHTTICRCDLKALSSTGNPRKLRHKLEVQQLPLFCNHLNRGQRSNKCPRFPWVCILMPRLCTADSGNEYTYLQIYLFISICVSVCMPMESPSTDSLGLITHQSTDDLLPSETWVSVENAIISPHQAARTRLSKLRGSYCIS